MTIDMTTIKTYTHYTYGTIFVDKSEEYGDYHFIVTDKRNVFIPYSYTDREYDMWDAVRHARRDDAWAYIDHDYEDVDGAVYDMDALADKLGLGWRISVNDEDYEDINNEEWRYDTSYTY
ncbi:hypothetical protein EJ419_06320 [Alloscardovia theropitheci]|uniref:Uncharacterized protein n=1 Tax=Alloscardovia theropitheci TaxID=2496842 RepID=A0A4R0QNV2_9BIFI|nr:hypothetical protein [Alloscardovia theropitheci]TCD53864.1 hypothetical protein EJ419_06320 [Alloscardovia theropitheci]